MPQQSFDRLRITPNTPIEDLEKRLSRSVSTAGSEARRQYLERTARWVTGVDVVVTLVDASTAACRPAEADDDADYHVRLPKSAPGQRVTDLDDEVWTLLFQEVELLHELGHVLYTDFEAARTARESYSGVKENTFKTYLNILEDGAIERELAKAFRLRNDLAVKNHNLFDGETQTVSSLDGAIQTALFDLAKHDTGVLDALLDDDGSTKWQGEAEDFETFRDEILPLCRSAVNTVCANPDPSARIAEVVAFFDEVSEYLTFDAHENQYGENLSEPVGDEQMGNTPEAASSLSSSQSDESETGDESGDGSTKGSEASQDDGREFGGSNRANDEKDTSEPPDGSSASSDADRDNEGHSGGSESDIDSGTGEGGDSEGDAAEEGETGVAAPSATSDSAAGEGSEGVVSTNKPQTDDDSSEYGGGAGLGSLDVSRYERQVQRERNTTQNGASNNVLRQEARDYARIIGEMDGMSSIEIPLVDNDESWSRDQWRETKREARRLKRAFERRLQIESDDQIKRHQLMGRLDMRALYRTQQGDARVFQRMVFPDEKFYSCVIVLDRSSSMKDRIETAEIATTALAIALYELGVNVTVLGMPGKPMLDMPFDSDPKQYRQTLLSNYTSGGTPLGATLALARERVRSRDGYPFVIVVTDGKAGDRERYFDELTRTRFPVLGVYLDESGTYVNEVKDDFDRVAITPPSGLGRQLKRMAAGIMF